MKLLRSCSALALLCVLTTPAVAQDLAPTSPATFLSYILGAAMIVITTGAIPLAIKWFNNKSAEQELSLAQKKLALAQIEAQLRVDLDGGVQKAVGGAIATSTDGGKVTEDNKSQIIEEAAKALAENFPDKFADLGVIDVPVKATEMVTRTVGLMAAQAAGNPVPNPSQPIAAPSTQTVNVAKK